MRNLRAERRRHHLRQRRERRRLGQSGEGDSGHNGEGSDDQSEPRGCIDRSNNFDGIHGRGGQPPEYIAAARSRNHGRDRVPVDWGGVNWSDDVGVRDKPDNCIHTER